ncbi:uncharacterized protein [Narcine bancroftii]|uniref:uncharacterized protein n=1 Tax=Narcine bancroftii TaxID=1343680 RepID=UPI00383207E5
MTAPLPVPILSCGQCGLAHTVGTDFVSHEKGAGVAGGGEAVWPKQCWYPTQVPPSPPLAAPDSFSPIGASASSPTSRFSLLLPHRCSSLLPRRLLQSPYSPAGRSIPPSHPPAAPSPLFTHWPLQPPPPPPVLQPPPPPAAPASFSPIRAPASSPTGLSSTCTHPPATPVPLLTRQLLQPPYSPVGRSSLLLPRWSLQPPSPPLVAPASFSLTRCSSLLLPCQPLQPPLPLVAPASFSPASAPASSPAGRSSPCTHLPAAPTSFSPASRSNLLLPRWSLQSPPPPVTTASFTPDVRSSPCTPPCRPLQPPPAP